RHEVERARPSSRARATAICSAGGSADAGVAQNETASTVKIARIAMRSARRWANPCWRPASLPQVNAALRRSGSARDEQRDKRRDRGRCGDERDALREIEAVEVGHGAREDAVVDERASGVA